jgi:uncharacterized protein YndB with AHSA1/START domain
MNGFDYDWTKFRRQIFVSADKKQVFRAWITAENITQWFIASARYINELGQERTPAEFVQPGDTYYWEWHQDLKASGTVLEVVADEMLKFTFGNKEAGSDEKIVVTVTFFEDGGRTRLELTQENMVDTPPAHVSWHMGCNLGWSFFMTNLKGFLEYGVDLRETDPERAYTSRAVNLI